jgi:Zn-finger domain-containing protein
VDKFKRDKDEMDLDDAMVMYEKAIALLREPTPAILEYLKVVTTLANNAQKLRGIAFIDVCLKNNTLTREADIKQLVRQMGKVIDNSAPP